MPEAQQRMIRTAGFGVSAGNHRAVQWAIVGATALATCDGFLNRCSAAGAGWSFLLLPAAVVWWTRTRHGNWELPPVWLMLAGIFLFSYAVARAEAPTLISAGLASMALGTAMMSTLPAGERNGALGLLCLLGLSINLGPTLDFYAGYPLRLASGWLASLMLARKVVPVGTALSDGTLTVFIDSPCSGVRMLATGMALAGALALLFSLNHWKTLMLGAVAVALCLLANAFRAAALFVLELAHGAPWLHPWVGLLIFCVAASVLAFSAGGLSRARGSARPNAPVTAFSGKWATRLACAVFGAALLVAAFARPPTEQPVILAASIEKPSTWPATWNGAPLIVLKLDGGLQRFLRDFPGSVALFQLGDGPVQILLRRCHGPTRALHPPEHCYRGMGWKIRPLPAWQDPQGRMWSRFQATSPDGVVRLVRQCYFSIGANILGQDLQDWIAGADSWPDVSSWYWAAARPGTQVDATLAVTATEVAE